MADYVAGRKVTHIMKDGSKRDSVKGLMVPCSGPTELAYKILVRLNRDMMDDETA